MPLIEIEQTAVTSTSLCTARHGGVELSVLIVSYNTKAFTIACLRSLYEHVDKLGIEVILVDNASSDGSADAISREFRQVRLIRSPVNLGFARANNLAAQYAAGDNLLLLNPDTVVLKNSIQNLVAFARDHGEAGIIGGRTLFADGTLNPTSCWGQPTLWSMFCQAVGLAAVFRRSALLDPESLGRWARDTIRDVDIVTGCFLLIRRHLWQQLGGFDCTFFMYAEDADLCIRARAGGSKCVLCPSATIVHYCGASEHVRADKMVRLFRAKAQLLIKHCGKFRARAGIHMLDLWSLTRMTAFGLLRFVSPTKADSFETWCVIWRRRHEWSATANSQ